MLTSVSYFSEKSDYAKYLIIFSMYSEGGHQYTLYMYVSVSFKALRVKKSKAIPNIAISLSDKPRPILYENNFFLAIPHTKRRRDFI